MYHRDTRFLTDLLDQRTSKIHNARVFQPRPSILNASYITQHTVEPVNEKTVGGCIYSVRIKKKGEVGDPESVLNVSLLERNMIEGGSVKIDLDFPRTSREDTAWVNMVAECLAKAYDKTEFTYHNKLPEEVNLKQLIASRVDYYKRGGNAQNLFN